MRVIICRSCREKSHTSVKTALWMESKKNKTKKLDRGKLINVKILAYSKIFHIVKNVFPFSQIKTILRDTEQKYKSENN